jgi:type IV pilus assembly protein PilC
MEIKDPREIERSKKRTLKTRLIDLATTPIGGLAKEKESLIENLAMLVGSGLDVLTAVDLVKYDVRSIRMLHIVTDLHDEINNGSTLWGAFKKYDLLPGYMIALMRIGEESGKLAQNMRIIVLQQRKNRVFKSKLVSAMIYPAIIFVLSALIGVGVFIFIIPRLATVYQALDIDLPLITRIMIGISGFLSQYWFIVIPLTLAFGYGMFYFLFQREKSKHIGQRLIFSIGAFRNVIANIELARFGFLFGTLLHAGLPILDSLTSLSRSTSFYAYQKFYDHLEEDIESGLTFKQSFEGFKGINSLIPVPIQQIIIAAEKSGRLQESMEEINETFEERVDTSSKNLAVILEPIMLILVWLGVVFVALSVIFPVYNLVGGVSNAARQTITKGSTNTTTETKVTGVPLGKIRIKSEFDSVDIKEFPNDGALILEVTRAGATYDYYKIQDNWYLVKVSGGDTSGWIYKQFIDVINAN